MRPATLPRSSAMALTPPALSRVPCVAAPTRLTSSAVSAVRLAAVSTLRAISCVAAPCSVTGGGNPPAKGADLADRLLDCRDRLDRALRRALHTGDLGADLFGGAT